MLSRLVPAGRNRRLYVTVSLVDALGSGAFAPITILYLTQIVGLSAVRVGLGLAIAGGVGMASTPVTGALADRIDPRTLTLAGFVLSGVGFLAYTAVHSFAAFLVVGSFIAVVETAARGGRKVLALAIAAGEDRIALLAYDRSTRNLGFGLGGLLASAALAGGSRNAYVAVLVANAVSYLLGAVAVSRLPSAPPRARQRLAGGYRTVLRDRRYLALAALTAVLSLNDSVLKVGLAVWIVERTSVPRFAVGLLFTLNTAMVVLLQVRTSRGAGTLLGAGRAYGVSAVAFASSCALFALAAHRQEALAAALLVAAVAALTLAELWASAGEWGASVTLAREELRGRYLAVFSTGSSLQGAIGPAIVTALLVRAGDLGWAAIAIAATVAGLTARSLLRHDETRLQERVS